LTPDAVGAYVFVEDGKMQCVAQFDSPEKSVEFLVKFQNVVGERKPVTLNTKPPVN